MISEKVNPSYYQKESSKDTFHSYLKKKQNKKSLWSVLAQKENILSGN